ncbi:MAG: helix-turn-helix transcriptional regulator [Aquincola sp.]|nr:helix-turn-helix transcriptional regulator [Aquincola sp.]
MDRLRRRARSRAPARWPGAARLAKLREEAGISQVQLAEKLGVTQQAVAQWERKRRPSAPTLWPSSRRRSGSAAAT